MELLAGRDLESLVREFGPVPADRAIYLLRQVCHSLADAHARGLVHRDIKPANIYVCRMGLEYDFVKVLDFGLVKFNGSNGSPAAQETLLTAHNTTTGTPAFMAPEIILGQSDVDRRADVYALGCVAYYLLTGQLVFDADTPMKMFLQHVQTPPMPPSQRTELPIPRDLDELVHGVPREGSEPAAAGCRAALRDGVPVLHDRRLGQRHGQRLVGNEPDRVDRPADIDRPAARGCHAGRRHSRMRSTPMPDAALALKRSDEKSWLDRALSLFTDVRAGEGATAALMLLNIFLLLICYSIIKIVREPLILLGGGAEVRSYAAAGQALLLMAFVPFYSWFASRVDRVKLLVGVTLFFVINIELFALAVAARRALRGRGVFHLGGHLQHLADRPVLVLRQRHLHQTGRRPSVSDDHDRHDRRRAAWLARRRPALRPGRSHRR